MMHLETLQIIWYMGVLILFAGYAVLDGFDLGVGIIHLFTKGDRERRILLNSIGPVWDGNEVWLVTAGGALFATFPEVYASLLSAFYFPVMFLLFGLIFRAVAIEFRSKFPQLWWRRFWDGAFSAASFAVAFVLGVLIGSMVEGIPLDDSHEFVGSFGDLVSPYGILVGIMTVALFGMHGAIYVVMKTEGELHDKIRSWINPLMITFIILYVTTTMVTLIYMPYMVETIRLRPELFPVALINMLAIANIPREITHGRDARGFVSSCVAILSLMALYALGSFPILLRASNVAANSLTLYNGSSTLLTLKIVLIVAVLGVPLVLAYTVGIYYIFRGKVRLDSSSY